MQKKKLCKARGRRMCFGVCGGLAEYFNLDPTWVRLGVVALCLIYGSGFLIYLVAAIILPEPEADGAAAYRAADADAYPAADVPTYTSAAAETQPHYQRAQSDDAQTAAAPDDAAQGTDAAAQEADALDVQLGGVKVELQPGESWALRTEGLRVRCNSVIANGVWHISNQDSSLVNLPGGKVIITYPVRLPLRQLTLQIGAGSLVSGPLCCQQADIEVGAGSMTLDDLLVQGRCRLQVGMGSLQMQGSLQQGAKIDCGMGSVKCRLERPASYGYAVNCGVGTVRVDGHNHSGLGSEAVVDRDAPVQYKINCGMGEVLVNFD